MKPHRTVVIRRSEAANAIQAMLATTPKASAADDAREMVERVRATPPKQERSLKTLNRLLDAAERVIEEGGLDAATVPAIAKRAGVSVGVVYRRFKNKDALIRGVYERLLWRVSEQNSMMLAALSQAKYPLHDLLRGVIHGAVEGNRRKRNLLYSLFQYARTHKDAAMRREAGKINRASTAAFTALMLTHRDQIKHPDPEEAIQFAVLTLAAVIRSVIIEEEGTHGLDAPANLEDELSRMIFGYLGISDRSGK
ncbi:MAG TPA: TetR/AcrR family transcriptional regulator [Thermoanaerobaculia bacterium]